MRHYILFFLALFISFTTASASPAPQENKTIGNVIPAPQEIKAFGKGTVLVKRVDAKVDASLNLPDEGYTLTIKGSTAQLRARTQQGLLWARQTLRQLKDDKGRVPRVSVRDWPAFPMRGFMYDTGRNFRPVDMLKHEIDLLAFYKLNIFHWHLTDHPAWRIQCKAYPILNDPKYQRKGRDTGKFYTYDEIREVIRYARERGVMVIPEIDMPGHSSYFKTAFGFDMASDEGMKVLKVLLEEFCKEIPAADCPYLHIGSDEVHVEHPKEFMAFCERIVRDHGRTPVCWHPGLPASPTTIRQVWTGAFGKQVEEGKIEKAPYLDSYEGYLNLGDPILNTSKLFLHTLCSKPQSDGEALGGILCLWNDVRVADKQLAFPQSGAVNGIAAFAERAWRGGQMDSIANEDLLPAPDSKLHTMLADFEQRLAYHRDHFLYDWDMRWVANSHIPWRVTLPEARGTQRADMQWVKAWGGSVDMTALSKRNGVQLQPTMEAWMETEIHVDNDTTLTAWFGLDTPNRSDKMSDGIGYQGHWNAQGRLFVNDTEVFPDWQWKQPGQYRYHYHTWSKPEEEVPITNEQLYWMHQPARLPLRKGWNRIRIYCPRVYQGNFWIVSFLPMATDSQGHVREATGITFREL